MSSCLLTTLKGTVEDDELPRIGDLVFNVVNPSAATTKNFDASVNIAFTGVAVEVVAIGGDFDDGSGNSLGPTITIPASTLTSVYAGRGVSKVIFRDAKYAMLQMNADAPHGNGYFTVSSEDLKYRNKLKNIYFGGNVVNVTGKVVALAKCPIDTIGIAAYSNDNKPIPTADLAKFTKLWNCELSWVAITGDFADLGDMPYLRYLYFMGVTGVTVKADLAKLPRTCARVISEYTYTSIPFSWESKRDSAYAPISLNNVKLGSYVDAMLINQAECTGTFPSDYTKAISVKGTRTSASDAAVTTLQNNGWTVTVTPES